MTSTRSPRALAAPPVPTRRRDEQIPTRRAIGPPAVLSGRYRLLRECGRGGMAVVYQATDCRLRRHVAVKVVDGRSTSAPWRQRFVREATLAARLSHPNIVAVFDAGEHDGYLYLVMELVEGESLAALIARRGPLAQDEAVDIGTQILAGLDHAHRRGVVHRDVKPSNVLVTADRCVKLLDFGVAQEVASPAADPTSPGQVMGTPRYMAPEQVRGGRATPATDIYATGVVLYELLAGAPLYRGTDPLAVARAHVDEPAPDVAHHRPDVAPHLAEALRRSLAKAPAERFASAAAMERALRHLRHAPAGSVGAVAATQVLEPPRLGRSFRLGWWSLAVLVALVAGTGLVRFVARGDNPPPAPLTTPTTAMLPAVPPAAPTAPPVVVGEAPPDRGPEHGQADDGGGGAGNGNGQAG